MEEVMEKKKSNSVLVWILVFIVIGLAGYIVYSDFVRPNLLKDNEVEEKEESNEGETEEKKEVPQDVKSELLNIVGIELDEYGNDVTYGLSLQYFLYRQTGVINEFSSEIKEWLFFWYSSNYNLRTEVLGSEYEPCMAGSGRCNAITSDTYNLIAKKYGITDSGESLFNKYNDKYLLWTGGFTMGPQCLVHSSVTFEYSDDDIVMTDKVIDIDLDKFQSEKKTKVYTFKKNGNDYYLYSVA